MEMSITVDGLIDIVKDLEEDKVVNKINRTLLQHSVNDTVHDLSRNTPVDTGLTSRSWGSDVSVTRNSVIIDIYNTNLTKYGVPVALLIALGHGTRGGVYIPPNDFISPSIDNLEDSLNRMIDK